MNSSDDMESCPDSDNRSASDPIEFQRQAHIKMKADLRCQQEFLGPDQFLDFAYGIPATTTSRGPRDFASKYCKSL